MIRVLNLWQKNEVFTADIIQPLFDLANSGSDLHRQVEEQVKRGIQAEGKVAPKAGSIQVVNQNSGNSQNQNSSSEREREPFSELDPGKILFDTFSFR